MTNPEPDALSGLRVRPYMVTGGRTRSVVELPLETIVRVTPEGQKAVETLSLEPRAIVDLCHQPLSIAEISAHLHLHLQVAKVLVGDLVHSGHVATHSATADATDRPDLQLLERVLDGLQSL